MITQVQDVEIKVCAHRFECDALKVAAIQTYGLISVMMRFKCLSPVFSYIKFRTFM